MALIAAVVMPDSVLAAMLAGPEIRTDDVTRFYALHDATGGRPTVEQIENEYLAKGSPSLDEFAQAQAGHGSDGIDQTFLKFKSTDMARNLATTINRRHEPCPTKRQY